MSRIEEIRAKLADYDAKMSSEDEEYGLWSQRLKAGMFADDVRALLVVAEAAQAVYAEHKRTYSAGQLIEELEAEQHRYDVVFGQLEVALAALDKQLDSAGGQQ